MFAKLFAITRNTFVETTRQPIFSILMWVAAGMLMLNPSLAGFSLENAEGDIKIVQDVGLATLLLYGLLAAVFSASSVITQEIESHTVLTVVSKPVNRSLFLIGKYFGVCGAVLVGYCFLCIVFFLTLRHGVLSTARDHLDMPVIVFGGVAVFVSLGASVFGNFVYGWHFPSTLTAWIVPSGMVALLATLGVSPSWELQSLGTDFGDLQITYAIMLAFCGVLILTAFAVAFATRFSQVVTLLLCLGVYIVGLLSDSYLGVPASGAEATWLYKTLYAVVPNFQFFWAGDVLTQDRTIWFGHVGQVVAYAGLYSLGVLGLGVAMFETREVG